MVAQMGLAVPSFKDWV